MKQQIYNTALYMRLSCDDENYGDSVSIENQRTILQQYARDNHLHIVDEYIDDGWSGTNFERPSFQRMIEDMEAGRINCIVTKDLSRFGREHIMMDYYLEFVFPERRVRYIAVTDNEDTEKGLSDFVPFKNLFNEWFAKDTSRKVKAAIKAKFAKGERLFTYAPIGYKRHPEIKNKLIIDEETCWIVQKIYSLAVQGAGAAKITRYLIEEKIPRPGYLNYQRNGKFANIYAGQPPEKAYTWTISQVKSILKDETYIGNSVHNKQTNISYKNKKKIRKPQEEWVRVEGTHEAIISKDDFDRVQELISTRRRKLSDATTQIFSGLIKCADCGWSMSYASNKTTKNPYSYYNCTSYRQYGKTHGVCTSHYIRYDVLYAYVLSRLQFWITTVEQDEQAILNRIQETTDNDQTVTNKRRLSDLAHAEKRLSELDNLLAKIYEDRLSGEITERNFSMLAKKYQQEQEEQETKIQTLKHQLENTKRQTDGAEKWIELVKRYSCPDELTAEILNTLIEKIVVHEASKDDEGNRVQEIEIFYRFVGKID